MALLAIDYAWEHPDPAAIKAAGYMGVLRYLSHDPSKDLSVEELAALRGVGLAVGVVWETTATEPANGAVAGTADGEQVAVRMDSLGFPQSVPCFYAFDTDDRGIPGWQDKVAPYLAAAAKASGRRALPYGSIRVVDFFGGGWQTAAWSQGQISAKAALYQRQRPTLSLAGGGFDEDLVIDPSVLWSPVITGSASSGVVIINNPPQEHYVSGLPVVKQGDKGQAVRNVQGLLVAAGRSLVVDGSFGPKTTAVLKEWQHAAGLVSDGVCGNASWSTFLDATVR